MKYILSIVISVIAFFSVEAQQVYPIGNELKMGLGLAWTANRFALFNFSTKENGVNGYADFNWFHFRGK